VRIEVPWGTGTTPVEVEGRRVAGVRGAGANRAENPDAVLHEAIERPGESVRQFLAAAPSPLLVVVNDATRPTPSADVLRVLRDGLEEWLAAPGNRLAFAVATGTHRPASPGERDRIFGPEVAREHASRIFSHDAREDARLVGVGHTSRGTDVVVNRLLADAASVLLVNSVEPHYFAGYTGGRKSLVPGLAGYGTVWANHRLSMEPGSETLTLAGNPVNADLEEAAAIALAGKRIYSIQLVLDQHNRVAFAAAGALDETFRRAVAVADTQFVIDVDQPYDVVVAAAPHPMDCNFYQTNKAIQSGARAAKNGGVLIVVSECPFGLGENQILFDMLSAAASPAEALERANVEAYRLGAQQAARVSSILARVDIWAVTSLEDAAVRAMFMTPFATVQAAVDAALARQGPEAQVLFLPEASITVPRVRHGGP